MEDLNGRQRKITTITEILKIMISVEDKVGYNRPDVMKIIMKKRQLRLSTYNLKKRDADYDRDERKKSDSC